jgi:hypothetical protein
MVDHKINRGGAIGELSTSGPTRSRRDDRVKRLVSKPIFSGAVHRAIQALRQDPDLRDQLVQLAVISSFTGGTGV